MYKDTNIRKCTKNSIENMQTDFRDQWVKCGMRWMQGCMTRFQLVKLYKYIFLTASMGI